MTIQEFITEAEVFDKSLEYYNLVKEAGEIALMEICINAGESLMETTSQEQANILSGIFIEAGFMTEAVNLNKGGALAVVGPRDLVDPNTKAKTDEVKKSVGTKIIGAFKKIGGIFVKAFNSVVTFFSVKINKAKEKANNEDILAKMDNTFGKHESLKHLAEKYLNDPSDNSEWNLEDKLFADGEKLIKALRDLKCSTTVINNVRRKLMDSKFNPEIKIPAGAADIEKFSARILNVMKKLSTYIEDNAKVTKYEKLALEIKNITKDMETQKDMKAVIIKFTELSKISEKLTNSQKTVNEIVNKVNESLEKAETSYMPTLSAVVSAFIDVSAKYNKLCAETIKSINLNIQRRETNFKNIAKVIIDAKKNMKADQ